MSTLPLFLLSQLALACPAASGFPAGHVVDRVTATAQTESGLQTTSVHDNTSNRSYVPATTADAVRLVMTLHAQGHSLDAGVMQVNDGNWPRLGLTAETVFDPRANVCAGMAVLAEAYAIERRVSCRYNTGKPDCANGYPERIDGARTQLGQLSPSPRVEASPPPLAGTPPCAPAWDAWALAACSARPAAPLPSPPAGGASPATLTVVKEPVHAP